MRVTQASTIATTVLTDAADAMIATTEDQMTVKVATMMIRNALEAIASAASESEEISRTMAMVVATTADTIMFVMTMGATPTAMAPATVKQSSAASKAAKKTSKRRC